MAPSLISLGRREGRAARRARRREALKDKRMGVISEKLARKTMVSAQAPGRETGACLTCLLRILRGNQPCLPAELFSLSCAVHMVC